MLKSEALVVLGFSPESNPPVKEVRKAYRTLALQHHPDRGGSHRRMVEINTARDILEGKRKADKPAARRKAPPPPPPTREQEEQAAANIRAAANLKAAADLKAAAKAKLAGHRQGRACPLCGQPQFCTDCGVCYGCYFCR